LLFNTIQFALFFALVWMLYRIAPSHRRNSLLLGASFVFYFLWIPSYLLLLLFDLGVNFALMRSMLGSTRPKLHLFASVAFTLILLGYFKYAAMLAETLFPFLASGLGWTPGIPDVFLPLGISFYSFQIIALSVDVYRRNIEPVESFGRYALFISFFPQLIAGPILRGHEFLGQLEHGGMMTGERNRRGLWLISSGLVKKVLLADFLLAPFVNEVYGVPNVASAPFLLIATYSFAFQIYFDFSGYSDIARGLALLLGFELPLNFEEPYLSKNPSEFWRRWHMTLSRWLRDYLYVPLSDGPGAARAVGAVFVTMFLGGLWHGAQWTFALWGVYHGVLLILHRASTRALSQIAPSAGLLRKLWDGLCVVATFQMICFGLTVFRSATFDDALTVLSGLFGGLSSTQYDDGWPAMQSGIVLLCIGLQIFERAIRTRLPEIQARCARHWAGILSEGMVMGGIVALVIAASGSGGEFIYFQF
jgi:alginate O-acetyltransferase complex protein AlgI